MTFLQYMLGAMVLGSICYTGIAVYATIRFCKSGAQKLPDSMPAVSILKPLCGTDRELVANLESFCKQDYPAYEIIFSVRDGSDAAVGAVRSLQEKFPSKEIRLLFTGNSQYPNAKVHAIEKMAEAARFDILVISDSDIRVSEDYLKNVVGPMSQPDVGMVTCLSRGVPHGGVWSRLESLGMNTQYCGGVLSAWLLIGMKFSLGPTMVIRKSLLEKIGGARRMGNYLADDFVLGDAVASAGYRVILSSYIPDHLFGGASMVDSFLHRLRWERSSQMSRPAGYLGQIFTHSVPLALLAAIAAPANLLVLSLAAAAIAARAILAWEAGWNLMRDPVLRSCWWLVPAQDLLAFAIWCWAFTGDEVVWRGSRFQVLRGGKILPKPAVLRIPIHPRPEARQADLPAASPREA